MQVSIETISGLERRLTVGIPAQEVEGEVNKRLAHAARTVRLNGFRKGKIPMKVVKQRFGAGVRQEVLGEVMSQSFHKAVQEQDVKPAGQPSIEPTQMEEGKDIEFVATFEVYPEIGLAPYEEFEISRYQADVSEADIDNMVEILRKQQATWSEVDREAKDGDQVNIDYLGTVDGEAFEGGEAEEQDLVLGSKSMIPGFEDGLLGLKAGEEKVVPVTFPEDYQAENLRGAAAEFKIKVHTVSEQELPELNEDFFKKYGLEEADIDKFRADVKSNMERELKNAAKAKVKKQVMDLLLEANQVELPKSLVAGEIEALRNQMMQQFSHTAGKDLDFKSILPDDMFKEQAERRVALGLIVAEVVKSADIKVDEDKVLDMVQELASTYQEPEQVVDYYYSNRELLSGVESAVLEDQVVEYILQAAKVADVESSYDEVIKQDDQPPQ